VERLQELDAVTRDQPAWRSFCGVEPVRVAVGVGRLDVAQRFLDGVQETVGWNACAWPTGQAMLAEARGETREAGAWYQDAAGLWLDYGSVVEQAYSLLGLGRCGDAEAAREAEAIFARLGARPVLARAA
jgi:hypothetical protein